MNGLQHSPLIDAERIHALPDRAAREAALLALEPHRRDMVSHFLVLRFAKALCAPEGIPVSDHKAVPRGAHEALIEQIPAHLVDQVKPLARSSQGVGQ
jgi:hypothetical protein